MSEKHFAPWNPDKRLADPFIIVLLSIILFLFSSKYYFVSCNTCLFTDTRPIIDGRVEDVILDFSAYSHFSLLNNSQTRTNIFTKAINNINISSWDKVLLSVHAAESGNFATGSILSKNVSGVAGNSFRPTWNFSYRNMGSPPSLLEFLEIKRAMGCSYAASILEARLAAKIDKKYINIENNSYNSMLARLLYFGVTSALLTLFSIVFIIYLCIHRVSRAKLPNLRLSGRAVTIVLLGWFTTLLIVNNVSIIFLNAAPGLKPIILTASYCIHALLGTTYICWAEDISFGKLLKNMTNAKYVTAIMFGIGFFSIIFLAALVINMLANLSPHSSKLAKNIIAESLLHPANQFWDTITLFILVVIVAPIFEEFMFRGVLLSWLSNCNNFGIRFRHCTAITITSLCFGIAHMQISEIPFFSVMGAILSFALMRSGNLLVPIISHSLWNAIIFFSIMILS